MAGALPGRRIRAGARLEIRVAAPGATALVVRIKVRAGKRPAMKMLCLPPGAGKPAACPD